MAISKELKPFLDEDAKGKIKKTRKNISKLLVYYGYEVKDVQEVFNVKSDVYSRYIDDKMVKREVATSRVYFTPEEQEIIEGYEEDIDRVYNKITKGSKKEDTSSTKRKTVKVNRRNKR